MANDGVVMEDAAVVMVEMYQQTRKMFGFSMGHTERPVLTHDSVLYMFEVDSERQRKFRLVNNVVEDIPEEMDGQLRFYRVGKCPYRCSFSFPRIKKDTSGHDWDFLLEGSLEINRDIDFLTVVGETYAQPKTPLTISVLTAWLAEQVRPQVHDAVAEPSLADLRDNEALPAEWWEMHLRYKLEEYGLKLRVDRQRWTSASAEAAEAEANRKQHFEHVKKQREEEREAELQEIKSRQAYEEEKSRIETDATLSIKQREHQLEHLETRHQTELARTAAELASIRRRSERESREHAIRMAQLQHDEERILSVRHCPKCNRPLLAGETLDPILNLCEWCAEEYRDDEIDREQIVPLRLVLSGPGAEATVFLFARRTLQWGRGRSKDLYKHLSKHPEWQSPGKDHDYQPRENDIVIRVMEADTPDKIRPSRERTLAISGVHGAITVQPGGKKERIRIIDFSSTGIYLKKSKLPYMKWHPCGDSTHITVGPSEMSDTPGLGISIQVFRSPDDDKLVQSVKLVRDNDSLAKKNHSYIMVVREAGIGIGADVPLVFQDKKETTPQFLGRIFVNENSFFYEPGPEQGFTSDGSAIDAPVQFEPGVILHFDKYSIEVNSAGERDFYEQD